MIQRNFSPKKLLKLLKIKIQTVCQNWQFFRIHTSLIWFHVKSEWQENSEIFTLCTVGNTENRRLRRRRGQASSNSGRHTENNSPWQKSPSCVKKKQKCHKNTFTKTIVFFWHTKGLYRTKLCCIPFSKEIIIFVTSLFFFLGNQKVNCKVAFLVYCKSW